MEIHPSIEDMQSMTMLAETQTIRWRQAGDF